MGLAALLTDRISRIALETRLAENLLGVVNSAAPLIDGDLLPLIYRRPDGSLAGEEEFEHIRGQLERVKAANGLRSSGSPLYILRAVPGRAEELEFVVMTDRDSNGRFFTGSRMTARAHGIAALSGSAQTTGVYEDEEGVWISGAAPIRGSNGEVAGFLQADRTIGFFHEEAGKQATATLVVATLCLCLGAGFALRMARGLASPVADLVRATQLIAAGELDHRTGLERNDELSDLAASIDRMAGQLEAARSDLLGKQDELTDACRRAEAANLTKSEFLAAVSHELRTPLNAIVGYTELLREDPLNAEQRHCAAVVEVSAARLRKMIDAVLDFSRIECGKMEFDRFGFAPAALVGQAAAAARGPAALKSIAIRTRIVDSVPKTLESDPARLMQVLNILVENAVKFTEAGEVVIGATTPREGWIRFEVSDTGLGVLPEARERLFRPFTQGDGSSTRRFGGAGLGLATAHRIVERMDGEIGFLDRPEGGSTFWFQIPVRATASAHEPLTEREASAA